MFDPCAADPLTEIRRMLSGLAGEKLAGRPAAELSDRVVGLVALAERVEAELVRTVAQWDGTGAWAEDGALSPVAWLAYRTTMARGDAARCVRTGRFVDAHRATAAAMASGAVSAGQAQTLAAVARGRHALYVEHEDALLNAAEALDADDFGLLARRWRSMADDQLASEDAHEVFERRHLHVSSTLFGTVRLDGELDPEGGATLLAALDALDRPDPLTGPAAPRSLSQRRADILVQLASSSLGGGPAEAGGDRPKASASVIIDFDTLVGNRPADLTAVRLDLERVGAIARDTALRLTCDATVCRVLMAAKSEVLDLGRSTRVVHPALRKALVIRDQTCQFPGCDRHAGWCDAHHLRHWAKGGATDLDNLLLLCRAHHVLCHEGGWHLARGPDGVITAAHPMNRRAPELVLAS